jgi:hypothetical protein
MLSLTKALDVVYGPDTGDLSLRIGMHSGPVTGGFLKGKGARFQLFGDTMNTTALVEASGEPGRIHISEETATLLRKAGKRKWLEKRHPKIETKAKGALQTFWLDISKRRVYCRHTGEGGSLVPDDAVGDSTGWEHTEHDDAADDNEELGSPTDRTGRLIDYNVEVLLRLLKQIIARRNVKVAKTRLSKTLSDSGMKQKGLMPIEEVKEIITLPQFDRKTAGRQLDVDRVEVPAVVSYQLKDYVKQVADMYRDNAFHNFDHASHVVTSVIKHMNRIIAPTDVNDQDGDKQLSKIDTAASLHDQTYGIKSDPLTQFACVYSALIHDLDHPGVPNHRLIQEDAQMAAMYKDRSVAEQNSFDIGKLCRS